MANKLVDQLAEKSGLSIQAGVDPEVSLQTLSSIKALIDFNVAVNGEESEEVKRVKALGAEDLKWTNYGIQAISESPALALEYGMTLAGAQAVGKMLQDLAKDQEIRTVLKPFVEIGVKSISDKREKIGAAYKGFS